MNCSREQFERRFYFWALEEWRREINEDFPLVRLVRDSIASNFLKIAKSLPESELRNLSVSLVKRRRQQYLEKWGEKFTEKEKTYIQLYFKAIEAESNKEARQTPAGGYPFPENEKKLNRSKLRKYITQELFTVLGKSSEGWYGGECIYETKVGPWIIDTRIDTGGQRFQLCYEHGITVSESVRLIEGISLLSWLGIAGGGTLWEGLYDSDIESTSKDLAKIVKHFMEAVPKLLEGLSPDE